MATGPRPTPHPIVLHVNDQGNPVRLAESSSIYVTTLSAVTVCATTYLGLEGLGGIPGGDLSSIQFRTGNTTFNGSPFLKYSAQLSGLLANAVSATRVIAANLSATTISATTYFNLPGTNLSSLLDVQYASVSGGQALVYSSSINKWAPGYRIFRSDSSPSNSIGIDGDIYFQYINDSTNAAYLSSLLDTNINLVSNGQSLIWSSGYWIASSLPIAQGAITNIPSASPIWNAASAEGYDIQWGAVGGFAPVAFDIVGFSLFDTPVKVTNFRASDAGPLLAGYTILNNISDLDVGNAQTNNILAKRADGYWQGVSSINVGSVSSNSISATTYLNLPSSIATWNANKILNIPTSFSNLAPFDILGVGLFSNTVENFSASTAGLYLASQVNLSAIKDVDDAIVAANSDTLVYINGFWTPSALNSVANNINLSSLKDVYNVTAGAGDVLANDGNNWGPTPLLTLGIFNYWNANKLQGYTIATTAPSANNVLAYNGTNWTPTSAISIASAVVSSLVAVSADLSSVKLTKYVEPKSTVLISTSSITLNLNNSQVFEISATSNISSITIQNPDARASVVQGFTIIFSADGTQRTVTNWGSIKWAGGTGPTLTSTNNKKDIFSFMSPDNGTNWYGFIGGQNF
jgi:hypothetical protein